MSGDVGGDYNVSVYHASPLYARAGCSCSVDTDHSGLGLSLSGNGDLLAVGGAESDSGTFLVQMYKWDERKESYAIHGTKLESSVSSAYMARASSDAMVLAFALTFFNQEIQTEMSSLTCFPRLSWWMIHWAYLQNKLATANLQMQCHGHHQ
jgi:hypothetical protein